MEERIFNKDEMENYGIEITSVSSFIDEVNKIKDDLYGSNEELFFRGQKTDFWDITPSIFRDYSLSVEHTLMQVPLLKVPHEFKSINNDFK
jgi:FRG domain protein